MINPDKVKEMSDEISDLASKLKRAELRYQYYLMTGNDVENVNIQFSNYNNLKIGQTLVSMYGTNQANLVVCKECGSNLLTWNGTTLECECGQWKLNVKDLKSTNILSLL